VGVVGGASYGGNGGDGGKPTCRGRTLASDGNGAGGSAGGEGGYGGRGWGTAIGKPGNAEFGGGGGAGAHSNSALPGLPIAVPQPLPP
jgi:hypothetical protein